MSDEKKITLYERFMSVMERNVGKILTSTEVADTIIEDDKEYYKHKISLKTEQAKRKGLKLSKSELENWGRDAILANVITTMNSKSYSNKFKLIGGEIFDNPRRYIYKRDVDNAEITQELNSHDNNVDVNNDINNNKFTIKNEHDLYPLLTKFLYENVKIHSMRINEKKSVNDKGAGGNKWLHPDIVGVQVAFDDMWLANELKELAHKHISHEQRFTLYSFEVKQSIASVGIAREYFFQALANSSWANYAYLVVPKNSIHQDAKDELQILMELHGVGLIELNLDSLNDSEFTIEPTYRELDWRSINRLFEQNKNFQRYINEIKQSHNSYHSKERIITEAYWDYEGYVKDGLFERLEEDE